MPYLDIVFSQSDSEHDDFAPHDTLYNVEGVVMHGASLESIERVATYLTQWDYGDECQRLDESPAGSHDDQYVIRYDGMPGLPGTVCHVYDWNGREDSLKEGDYVLAAHRGLGYVGLTRYTVQ